MSKLNANFPGLFMNGICQAFQVRHGRFIDHQLIFMGKAILIYSPISDRCQGYTIGSHAPMQIKEPVIGGSILAHPFVGSSFDESVF
jgi:hypothetical protein